MKEAKQKPARVGAISNYYGGLYIRRNKGKPQWALENWDGLEAWHDIPEFLYEALEKYRNEGL